MQGKRETRTFSSRSPEASKAPSVDSARQVPTEAVCPSRKAERLFWLVFGFGVGVDGGASVGLHWGDAAAYRRHQTYDATSHSPVKSTNMMTKPTHYLSHLLVQPLLGRRVRAHVPDLVVHDQHLWW